MKIFKYDDTTKLSTEQLKSLATELDILSVFTKKELGFAKKHGITYVGTCAIQDWTVIDWPIRGSLLKLPGVEGEYICKIACKDHTNQKYVSKFKNVGWISRDYGKALKYHWRNIDWYWEFKRYQTHQYWDDLQSLVNSQFWKKRVPEIKLGNLKFNKVIKTAYVYGKPTKPFGNEHQFLFSCSLDNSLPYGEYTFDYLLIFDSSEPYRDNRNWLRGNMTSRHLGVNIDYEQVEDAVKKRFFGISRGEEKYTRELMFIGAKDKHVFLGLSTDVGPESVSKIFKGLKFNVAYYIRSEEKI